MLAPTYPKLRRSIQAIEIFQHLNQIQRQKQRFSNLRRPKNRPTEKYAAASKFNQQNRSN
jgi:hypothetical protein